MQSGCFRGDAIPPSLPLSVWKPGIPPGYRHKRLDYSPLVQYENLAPVPSPRAVCRGAQAHCPSKTLPPAPPISAIIPAKDHSTSRQTHLDRRSLHPPESHTHRDSAYPFQKRISVDVYSYCIYNTAMKFTWNETKRSANLRQHGFDFADASEVFSETTFTFEDDRFDYGEQRYVTLGMLKGTIVSIVHTETPQRIRIISFRKATRNEQIIYFKNIANPMA